jgi:D-alanyl-D-alanine carboxypeptidase (penicillin-binding protein 5/6)
MKSFALLIALLLHTTGLWSRAEPSAREHLASQALGQPIAAIIPSSKPVISIVSLPIKQTDIGLDLGAKTILAVDTTTMLPLYSKNAEAKVPIASITKTITALTILQRHSLDEVVTIKKLPTYAPEDDTMGLVEGDTFTVRQLVQAAMIKSANDAADALALWDADTIPKFTTRMNTTVAGWGITSSHFASPSGLQDTNNYATASDLARIGKLILTNPFIKTTVNTSHISITSGQNHQFELNNTNILLENGRLYGIKTGYTVASGECLLGITTIHDHSVITVILGSNDRFGDTVRLINWIGSSYQWL